MVVVLHNSQHISRHRPVSLYNKTDSHCVPFLRSHAPAVKVLECTVIDVRGGGGSRAGKQLFHQNNLSQENLGTFLCNYTKIRTILAEISEKTGNFNS